MKKLYAFYFSGTGNTRFVVRYLIDKLSENFETEVYDITQKSDFKRELSTADIVLIAFPIYGSSPPIPIRNFVLKNNTLFKGKKVAIAETQYFFSGDGSASLGRTLEKYGAVVEFAEHFNMPNNLSDGAFFKVRNGDELNEIIDKTKRRMDVFANKIVADKRFRRGFNPVSHAVGYFCQRKWWRRKESQKRSQIKINRAECAACGKCVKNCPVGNLMLKEGSIVGKNKCVFCYRCVNLCPKKAITLFGKEIKTSYKGIE